MTRAATGDAATKDATIRKIADEALLRSTRGDMCCPSVPVKSVPELIAPAKANPGKITMASAGIGSSPHMCWELFRSMAGIDMLHVHYRGGGPALTDLLGGQVQAYMPTLVSAIEHIRAGKFRTLAVTPQAAQACCRIFRP